MLPLEIRTRLIPSYVDSWIAWPLIMGALPRICPSSGSAALARPTTMA